MLGTLIGSVAGAIGANALEHKHKKHKEEKKYSQQGGYDNGLAYGAPPAAAGGLYPGEGGHGHHHHHHHHGHRKLSRSRSRSRGIDSDSE